MKILLATYWQYPSTGAIDIYLRMQTEELKRRGHEPHVLCRGPDWMKMKLISDEVRTFDLAHACELIVPGILGHFAGQDPPPRWITEREAEQYLYELGALRLCNLSSYDLIHAHDVHTSRAMRRLAPDRVPVVLTTHGLLAYEWLVERRIPGGDSLEWKYTFLRETMGIEASDITIVPSEWMRREYVEYFRVPEQKLVVVPYGKHLGEFDELLKHTPSGLPDLTKRRVITCVARLVDLKGHEYLLKALTEVCREVNNVLCLLVGDGPLEEHLKSVVKDLKLEEHVLFLGRRDDVPALLSKTDVLVLPSVQEITPLVIIEAHLAGKPVIASDVGGVPNLIRQGETGIMVPPQRSDLLATEINRVLLDSALAKRLGDRARARALMERGLDTHLSTLLGVYETALLHKKATEGAFWSNRLAGVALR